MKPKLIVKIDKKEEQKYLKYIHDNFDKKTEFNKFTKKQNINSIKREWKEIEKNFFTFVKGYCKKEWKYKKYYAILSDVTNYSFSSPLKEHKNKVLVDLKTKEAIYKIICHELLHVYFDQIYKGNKKDEDIYHELFVTHMLFDTKLKNLFKDKITPKQNLILAGHKKQYQLYPKSKKIWEDKKDINDYINKLSQLLK